MTNVPQSPDQASQPHLDNLAKLHRMSRTAGLATTDYAAVNVAAVMTAILGVASFLAIVDRVFLVIPVAGVIVGIIALTQVLGSNRTQTGLLVAILGLAACAGFSGVSGYRYVSYLQRQAKDQKVLADIAEEFGKHLAAENYDAAYGMFDARLKDRVSKKQLEAFIALQVQRSFGKVRKVQPPTVFQIDEATDDTGARMAQGIAVLETENPPPQGQQIRPTIVYRYVNEQWQIFNIPEFFPPQNDQTSGPPIPSGPMGPMLPGAPAPK